MTPPLLDAFPTTSARPSPKPTPSGGYEPPATPPGQRARRGALFGRRSYFLSNRPSVAFASDRGGAPTAARSSSVT